MKVRLDGLLIRLIMLCLVGIVALQVLGKPELASVLFTLTFFLAAALWILEAAERMGDIKRLALWILLCSAGAVCCNALGTGTAVSGGYFKKLILFWTAVLCFSAVAEGKWDARTVGFLFRWNTALAFFLVGAFLLRREQMFRINGIVTVYLTFGFTNPNLAAAFLSAIGMMEWIRWKMPGRRRWLHWLLGMALTFFVWQTRARNARLILGGFLAVLALLQYRPGWEPRLGKRGAAAVSWMPMMFAGAYLLLISVPLVQRLFSFLAGEGKGLDSRVEIWRFALEAVAEAPLTGAYSQISGGSGASQMHNSHLDLLASYGVPVLVLTCVFLARILCTEGKKGRLHFLCQTGFGAMLLSGLGEAMLFSGGMGICLYAGMLLVLAGFDFDGEERL